MSTAENIARLLESGKLSRVPTFVPWGWSTICGKFTGTPYVWGVWDCSRSFWHVSGIAGYLPTPSGNTDSMLAYPSVAHPFDGCAALFGSSATDAYHVARVVQTGDGLKLWHAHGGGSANGPSNPGGPSGLSDLTYNRGAFLGYRVVVPDVTASHVAKLANLPDDFNAWYSALVFRGALPGKP